MDLMQRRRAMMAMSGERWDYVLLPEADGRVQKANIPVYAGQHIRLEWDTTQLPAGTGKPYCVFSFYTQISSMKDLNPNPYASGYPICWDNGEIGTKVYRAGYCDIDIPKDMTMYIGYWRDSDTTDRRIPGAYIKIRID